MSDNTIPLLFLVQKKIQIQLNRKALILKLKYKSSKKVESQMYRC